MFRVVKNGCLGNLGSDVMLRSGVSRQFPVVFRSISVDSSKGQQVKGQVAQKTPAKIRCEVGQTYKWCACGLSSKQPLCDGSHKRSTLGLTPVPFIAKETKDYMFCNCKQTNNRPLCDGSHKKL